MASDKLDLKLPNYGLWVLLRPMVCSYFPWLLLAQSAEMSPYNKDYMAHGAENIYHLIFHLKIKSKLQLLH